MDVSRSALPVFWPSRPVRSGRAFEAVGTPWIARVRHLPTAETILRTSFLHGAAAHALLAEWLDVWSRAVGDVDAFAQANPPCVPDDEAGRIRAAHTAFEVDHRSAAVIVQALQRGNPGTAGRDESLHVLEDARMVTELVRSGCDFALVLQPGSPVPTVLAGGGGLGGGLPFRLYALDGTPEEQDFHAATVRRVRGQIDAVNPYWESPAFLAAAGREMALARGGDHLSAVLFDMAFGGHSKAFLKSSESKRGTWIVDLSGIEDLASAGLAAHAAMGPFYGDLWERQVPAREDILVQEFLPFTHEHRFLVVDGRVVASTASVRDLSVLDHCGRILHPACARLREPAAARGAFDRGASDTVADRALVATMAWKARRLARELSSEGMVPRAYCLDMGLTERGVVPVEVNTAAYCGLYAVDWRRFAKAVAKLPPPPSAESPEERRRAASRVEDAVEFMLDILSDEPPHRVKEVATELSRIAEDAKRFASLGMEARARHLRELDEPLHVWTPVNPAGREAVPESVDD